MALPSFVTRSAQGTNVQTYVQPRAARDGIVGVQGQAMKIKVTAPPVDDRANRAVETILSEALGVPRRDVHVVRGHRSRNKVIEVRGAAPDEVAAALSRVLSSRAHEPGQETD